MSIFIVFILLPKLRFSNFIVVLIFLFSCTVIFSTLVSRRSVFLKKRGKNLFSPLKQFLWMERFFFIIRFHCTPREECQKGNYEEFQSLLCRHTARERAATEKEEEKWEVKHETMRKEFESTFPLYLMISELLVASAVFS